MNRHPIGHAVPVATHHRIADDDGQRCGSAVRWSEGATAAKRDPQRFEIAWRDGEIGGELRLALEPRASLDRDTAIWVVAVAGGRNPKPGAGADHVLRCAQTFEDAIVEGGDRGIGRVSGLERIQLATSGLIVITAQASLPVIPHLV